MKRKPSVVKSLFLVCCLALATVASPAASVAAGGGTSNTTQSRAGVIAAAACGISIFFGVVPAVIGFCGFAMLDAFATPD